MGWLGHIEAHGLTGATFLSSLQHFDHRCIGSSYHDLTRRVYVAHVDWLFVGVRLSDQCRYLSFREPNDGGEPVALRVELYHVLRALLHKPCSIRQTQNVGRHCCSKRSYRKSCDRLRLDAFFKKSACYRDTRS